MVISAAYQIQNVQTKNMSVEKEDRLSYQVALGRSEEKRQREGRRDNKRHSKKMKRDKMRR